MKVYLLGNTVNPEYLVATSAKLCYSPSTIPELVKKQTSDGVEKFCNMLSEIGHESPIEHVSFTFGVEGVSRVLTHQLVRHRIASYSQQSQRYVKEGQFEYIVPKEIENSYAKNTFIKAMEMCQKAYNELVEKLMLEYALLYNGDGKDYIYNMGEAIKLNKKQDIIEMFRKTDKKAYNKAEKKAIENARYVLPNACETKIILTMNARSLKHFFSLRCCNRAQDEIRELADEMLKICKREAPLLFKNAGAPCVRGKCPEGSMSCGNPRK